MSVEKYRKKPVEIEAVQWDGTAAGATPVIDWILSHGGNARYRDCPPTLRNNPHHSTRRRVAGRPDRRQREVTR